MIVGDRVVIVKHPLLRPAELWGYDGIIVGVREDGVYLVRMPWLVKTLECIPEILRLAPNDCRVNGCTYAEYENVRCGWHL